MRESPIVPESATVVMNTMVMQKITAGITVYNLSVGEPKLPPHPFISEGVILALSQGKTFYPPVSGVPALLEQATQWMNVSYHCRFTTENCLVVNGGKFGIYLLMQLLLNKADEVIVASPYWVSYPSIVNLFKGVPVLVETDDAHGWKLTPHTLKKACTSKTKILILNNANNPTGVLYSKSELRDLLEVAHAHDLWVISDEVYSGLIYDNATYISCAEFPEYQERVVVIQSCSKNFSMTGWRIGFVFGPNHLIKSLTALLSQSTSGVTTISQWAAFAAFQNAETIIAWVARQMENRREVLMRALNEFFGLTITPPPSSLYVFLSLADFGVTEVLSQAFCKQALEQANVSIVPGIAFGKEGYVRISFGAEPDVIHLGIKALAEFCNNLRK